MPFRRKFGRILPTFCHGFAQVHPRIASALSWQNFGCSKKLPHRVLFHRRRLALLSILYRDEYITPRVFNEGNTLSHIVATMSLSLKCAATNTRKGKTSCCRRNGKLELDGFCNTDHMEEAKKYAPDGYNKHVECVKSVMKNKALIEVYNDKLRPMFSSAIIAGRAKEQADFLLLVGAEYATSAKEAWDKTAVGYGGEETEAYKATIAATVETRKGIKRKQLDAVDVKQLVGSLSLDDDVDVCEEPVLKQRKARGAVGNDRDEQGVVDEVERVNAEVLNAAQQPLPDSMEFSQ